MAAEDFEVQHENSRGAPGGPIPPRLRRPHDSDVTFEEYIYYAKRTRAIEKATPITVEEQKSGVFDAFLGRKPALPPTTVTEIPAESPGNGDEKRSPSYAHSSGRASISDEEWINASRMMRTASWGAGFYLITTDILGPYGVGFAMGTLGWGPGVALYTVFGFMAGYSGYLLWKIFLGLDSHEFPLRNYGDLAFRLFGSIPRHLVNALQSIQLISITGQVIIQNGQGISQVSRFRLCYAVCCVIFMIVGFFLGQVRTLRNFGALSSIAVGLNLMVIFISMGVIAHSPPNYAISVLGSAGSAVEPESIKPNAQGQYPAIKHYGGLPDPDNFKGAINGLMQGVFAYGGAQLFVEIMAEMRRPWDFFKAMCTAQVFIYAVYLIYGAYVYNFQGQYSYQISYQGVSIYGWQVVGDMLAVLSGLIAAALYGNIGIKVFYNNLMIDLFNAPLLTTTKGKIIWAVLVPLWWTIAFIIAAAIPDYFGYVGVISAICVIQFTYSFPPILALGYYVQKRAMRGNDGFDPKTGVVTRGDRGLKRWVRGFFAGPWYWNVWYIIHAGAALATAGLGAYSSIESMIEAFKIPQVNAFTCASPLDLSKLPPA